MSGFIGVGQLRYSMLTIACTALALYSEHSLTDTTVLTNLGEKMSDDEVDELLKAVDTSSGEINYTDLVRTILAN